MPLDTPLLAELRRRIKDVRYSQRAMGVAVSDSYVTNAYAEITNGRFMVNVVGGTAPNIDIDLASSRYDTVGKLYQAISRLPGYTVSLDEDAEQDHLSTDLEPFGPIDIQEVGINLRHRLFSDIELTEILQQAVSRHNPTFTVSTLPPQENVFVLMLAHSQVITAQAYDASKRRGMDATVETLLAMAQQMETTYVADTSRLQKALHSPKGPNPNTLAEGDVVLGKLYRRSMRTGFMSPISQNLPPSEAIIIDFDERDIEDTNARIRWERNRDMSFFSYELWMDSQPEVQRSREGLVYTTTPFAQLPTEFDAVDRRSSSTLVFRSFGPNSNFNRSTFSTFVEEFGQLMTSFVVPWLEPESVYYFRLFIVDLNYESVGSNVLQVRTKTLRCRFTEYNWTDKTSGPPGTVVTLNFDPARGQFTTAHELRIGDKQVVPTIITPFQVSFVVPSFVNRQVPKDLVVTSPTKLVDVRREAFTVTA